MSREIAYLGLMEVSDRIRRRELTSEAVTRALLDRIDQLDGDLRSFQMVLADAALDQARTADREIGAGLWRGPLHGVPLGVKDLLFTKGWPTAAGMPLLATFTPDHDATVVARLKRAGAVIIGKLAMTEGATLLHHPEMARPVNPWSARHWTGVSSSGSGVAPAAGLCYGALGTDTGGSIRMPCAATNLTGIKPTWGRVSRHGLVHLAESLDHLGPMARSVADAAAILQAIAGADPADPTALTDPVPDYLGGLEAGVGDLVVGVDWRFATEGVAPEVSASVRLAAEVFADLGARVREIAFPPTATLDADTGALLIAEIGAAHAAHFPARADAYGVRLRRMLEAAARLDGARVARAYQARDRFAGALTAAFRDCDLILVPGLGDVVPTWEAFDAAVEDYPALGRKLLRFTTPFNLAGVPTLSLPGGFTEDGLPIGLQLAGRKLAEPALIAAGQAFQQVTDFHTRRPPVG